MNILQMEDMVKGLPDEMLMQEAQMPSGRIPQFLALSEVQRRKEMRDRFQQPPQATVADQILQGGIASAMPQQPPQGGMAPPQGAPMGAPQGPIMAYGGGRMPYGMADGGAVPSGLQEFNNAMVSARQRRGQGFLESVAPNPMNSLQAAKDLPARLQALQRMADTGPNPYEPGNYGYTQSESGLGNDPFRMGPSGFIQAGHQAEALDRAGAMALGNRYQDYLNRMTNPFAGTGSGIVRDERLGDQSLNLDDYGMGMYGGGQVPYRMQEGRTVPGVQLPSFGVNVPSFKGSGNVSLLALQEIFAIPEELRTPEQQALIESVTPQMEQLAMSAPAPQVPENIPPPVPAGAPAAAGTPPAGAPTAPGAAPDSFMQYVPQVQQMVSAMMPAPAGFDVAGYTKAFKPQESDYLNPEFQKQRQKMVEDLRTEAQKRREADIALAQRYMSEAETPIKKAEEEAKKAAIGAVLTRLGAGLMRGDAAAGLAAATESAESIIGRQRELSAVERRAAKQEFRAAERDAIRSERGSADQAFNMEAQNLTADENAQRQYVRDSKQFSQQVFGLLRDAGKDQRAAHMDSIRLTFSISQAIDTALREQKREAGLTDRQYMQTFGSVFDKILSSVQDSTVIDPVTKEERSPTADELIELANKKATEVLQGQGIFPAPVVKVKTQEEYNKLPSGTVFIDPQGMKRTKP